MRFQEELLSNSPMDAPKIDVVYRKTNDVLDQAQAMPLWSQDYIQLSKGKFSGTLNLVTHQGVQVFQETMNRAVDQIALAPSDAYVIGLPSIIEGEPSWGMLPVKPNSLITLDKNAEMIYRTSGLSEITCAVISAQRLEEFAAQVEWIDLRKAIANIKPVELISHDISSHLLATLERGIHYISEFKDSEYAPLMWHNFENELMIGCLQAIQQASTNTSHVHDHRIHRYIVNRVRDLTLSSSGYLLSIEELCIVLRISRRTLNHAFVRVLGITPVAYIRNVRLHRIRAELKSASNEVRNISSVAAKWGFWHMSLFSRYYRELFGELPIETLSRCRIA